MAKLICNKLTNDLNFYRGYTYQLEAAAFSAVTFASITQNKLQDVRKEPTSMATKLRIAEEFLS